MVQESSFLRAGKGKIRMDFQEEKPCALAKGLSYLGPSCTLMCHLYMALNSPVQEGSRLHVA